MSDILTAIDSVKLRLKDDTLSSLERTKLTEDLLSLYVCMELEVRGRM